MNLGENIKRCRNEKKMTQSDLAISIDRSLRMVQKYEANDVTPSLEIIKIIADALDVPIYRIMGGEFEDLKNNPNLVDELIKLGDKIKDSSIKELALNGNRDIKDKIINEAKINRRNNLITYFDMLNINGQNKAIESVELLTKIPEYLQNEEGEKTDG